MSEQTDALLALLEYHTAQRRYWCDVAAECGAKYGRTGIEKHGLALREVEAKLRELADLKPKA